MSLQLLPDELLLLIVSGVERDIDINSLVQTNRRLYAVLNSYLYQYNIRYFKSSALHWAAIRGRLETAKKILDQGAVGDSALHYGQSLVLAIINSQEEMVKLLLKQQDLELPYHGFTSRSVWAVISTEHEGILRLLMEDGRIDLNYRDPASQMTPLLYALRMRLFNIAEILLESGIVEVNIATREQATPLCYAACYRGERCVALLLAKGADPNYLPRIARSPLPYAAWTGCYPIVKMLVDAGADINHGSPTERTPLSYAATGGSTETVKLLLDAGSDPNSRTSTGSAPILYAAASRHDAVVRLLLEYGADPDCIDTGTGKSPLLSAAELGDEATVKLLLDDGRVDINRPDAFMKQTPLCYAAISGNAAVVRMLLEKGADPNVGRGYRMRTPLSFAAENGRQEAVEVLLKLGARLDTEGQQQSPVSYAVKNGHKRIAELLVERGAGSDICDPVVARTAGMEELLHQTGKMSLVDEETN